MGDSSLYAHRADWCWCFGETIKGDVKHRGSTLGDSWELGIDRDSTVLRRNEVAVDYLGKSASPYASRGGCTFGTHKRLDELVRSAIKYTPSK